MRRKGDGFDYRSPNDGMWDAVKKICIVIAVLVGLYYLAPFILAIVSLILLWLI